MEKLKYTVIKSDEQYYKYCNIVEELDFSGDESDETEEEIELLTVLIEDYDRKHSTFRELDPVELLKAFIKDHGLRQKDLANISGIGKSYMSEILNYKKRMSKEVIRKLADRFKIRQEALNRPYKLVSDYEPFEEESGPISMVSEPGSGKDD